MPRQSYVFDRETNTLVERDAFYSRKYEQQGSKFSNVIPLPYVTSDLRAYRSPITGKMVEGRAARREDLARTGCREVDPSEYKPIYRNYEFCQKRRLPFMGGDVPPPMTKDQRAEAKWRRAQEKKAEKSADAVRAKAAEDRIDPDLAKFARGNPKMSPLFKIKPSAKDA